MLRNLFLMSVFVAFATSLDAQEKRAVDSKPLDDGFLRQYAETRGFMLGRPTSAKFTPDGKSVLFLRAEAKKGKRALYEFNLADGTTKELLSADKLLKGGVENLSPEEKARRERMRLTAGGFADYQLDESGKSILLPLSGKLFLFDRASANVRELKTSLGVLIDPKWSPDGTKIAYVLNQDVYVYDLGTDKETAVTKGGTVQKTHGLAEFVAQEEMARMSGYWWSPDSKFLAYEEADHEGVEMWYVADPTKPEQAPLPQYYPRPGKKNVAVRLGVVSISGGETTWVDWDVKKYEYLAAVRWDKHGPLTIQVQDRKQQTLVLYRVDPQTGKTTELLTEKDAAFINLRQDFPKWQAGARMFFWVSEHGGAPALEFRFADGKVHQKIVDEKEGFLTMHRERSNRFGAYAYYVAAEDSTRSGLYRRTFEDLMPRRPGSENAEKLDTEPGMVSAQFAERTDHFVLSRTSLTELPRSYVRTWDKVIGELPSVAENPNFKPNVVVEKLGGKDGFQTAVVRPHGFDPKKKYPVIVDVYGGPHHLHVTQSMRSWLLMQWMADQGFIVVAIENRGTPGHGRDWERSIYQKFGSIPLEDQVKGLELLGKKYPEMDMERVGMVGWSFGGYMSALAVLKRPDVFKAAVAGAPVTDWEDYDTHYTERYMGLLPESKKAYEESSLLPLAPKLDRPLLLVHGTADDNVYFRHTLRLTDALFRAGRDFEVLPLPSLTHMVPDPIVTIRLWSRISGHFQKHLGKPK